ncbi:MAG TPA: enoyl-CoA hydratase-related protein [Streptosporangiaceae bacterium]|nr:enoyl-CoA hydratase-related protein [Streptosporangiaceae bacterium]
MSDSVLWDLDEAVATITLNRPAAMNALTVEMKGALRDMVHQAASDRRVRALVITGAGKGFCAGQDLREHAQLLDDAAADGLVAAATDTVREHYNPIVLTLTSMPKPVIAAVNGMAAGAGAGMALACDFRIMARQASFLMAFARVGLAADSGTSWTLQRLAGLGRAAELLMLAEPVPADRALQYGLATSVVDDTGLAEAARSLAQRLAAGPTAAYAGIKQQLSFSSAHSLIESLDKEADVQAAVGRTADHRDATVAFTRKEQATFQGH